MIPLAVWDNDVQDINTGILKCLAYFDLFGYPLTREDIALYIGVRCGSQTIEKSLDELTARRTIYKLKEYYSLRDDERMVSRREAGYEHAMELIVIAETVGHYLIKFPFVRGIAISGSVSKRCADEQADIDFFIITAPNRLWIARSFLHFLKKLSFLFNKQDYFCMNYFIDQNNLEITEKNLFTAIETTTLIPIQGDVVFDEFFSRNNWLTRYLPNNLMRVSTAKPLKRSVLKNALEFLLNGRFGNLLDNMLMRITGRRWNKKTSSGKVNAKGMVLTMMASKGCAKPNPVLLQTKVLNGYRERSESVLERLNEKAC